jgi:hypothetical protein
VSIPSLSASVASFSLLDLGFGKKHAFSVGLEAGFQASSLAFVGSALEFFGDTGGPLFGVAALVERLHYSIPLMTESGVPIYPSESKHLQRYSRKSKVGRGVQLYETLIAKVVVAISGLG